MMVYVFGIGGFVLGFAAGMVVIHSFLRSRKAAELMRDRSLRWTYGLAVWLMAGLGAALGVWVYDRSVF